MDKKEVQNQDDACVKMILILSWEVQCPLLFIVRSLGGIMMKQVCRSWDYRLNMPADDFPGSPPSMVGCSLRVPQGGTVLPETGLPFHDTAQLSQLSAKDGSGARLLEQARPAREEIANHCWVCHACVRNFTF